MYDELLKAKCENPIHYDRMIELIVKNNPSCKGRDWATDAINNCIMGVLYNETLRDYATGGCMAMRGARGVRLFFEPLFP